MSTTLCGLNLPARSSVWPIATGSTTVLLLAFAILGILTLPQGEAMQVWRITIVASSSGGIIFLNIALLVGSVKSSCALLKRPSTEEAITPTDPRSLFPFEQLPSELKLLILSFLDPRSIGKCSLVSRELFKLTQEETPSWMPITLWEKKAAETLGLEFVPRKLSSWKELCLSHALLDGPCKNILHKAKWTTIKQNENLQANNSYSCQFGDLLYCWTFGIVCIFDLKSKKFLKSVTLPNLISIMRFLDANRALVRSRNNKIFIWNFEAQKQEKWEIQEPQLSYSYRSVGNYFLIGDGSTRVNRLFENSGKFHSEIKGRPLANNGTFALFDKDKCLTVWNIASKEKALKLPKENSWGVVKIAKFSKDYFAVFFQSNEIRVWDLEEKMWFRHALNLNESLTKMKIKHDFLFIDYFNETSQVKSRKIFLISQNKEIYSESPASLGKWIQPNLLLCKKYNGNYYIKNVFTQKILKEWPANASNTGYTFLNILYENNRLIILSSTNPHIHMLEFSKK